MMAAEEEKSIEGLVSSICKDGLQRRKFKDKFENFLTNVKVPSGWEDKGYKLEPDHTTYKYRYKLLKNFIDRKRSEGFNLTSATSEQFFDELEQFKDSDTDGSFCELDHGHRTKLGIDLFEQNIKLEGVVVLKSDKRLEAFVLIKTKDCSRRSGAGSFSLSELIVSLHDEGEGKSGEGFYLKVAEGDVVEVSKCRRKNGTAWELEIIKCFTLSETEIELFLNHLSSCVQSSGSSATVTEITRLCAAWEYILNLSKETYTDQMTSQILDIINKICSSVPMSHTVSEIAEGFQQSTLFRSALPDFIDKITEESCVSMVQKILEHVITAVPARSCFKVFEMANALAHNSLKGSSDLEKAKHNGQTAIDFLTKLSLIIASEVPGARTDIEALPWKELPLIPAAEEIHKPRLKTNDLPVIRKEGKYESEEEYLNTHFRLLREECFYKLRKGISDFVESGQKCDSKDMMMYRICLRGVSMRHEYSPTVMLIALEYELPDTRDSSESENEGQLLYGNLLCISMDGTFQAPVWAVVDKHITEDRIVTVTLCDKANTITEPQFIAQMQGIANIDKKAFMAESQTFYVSFAPAMEVLQHRDHVPFKEFLVYPDPLNHMEPAEYINKIKRPPDWEIIFRKDSLSDCSRKDESCVDYSLLKEFDGIRLNSSYKAKLDDTQLAAVELALKNRLVLIQGPPGTGKSFVGVALVRLLLSMNVPQDHGPILVVTYKNHALNNFLTDCLSKVSSPDVKIVRVGRLDEDHELKKCLLREMGRQWPQRLYNQKRKLLGQIWALQPKVREAFEKLRTSSRFSADMFLKEASEDQLKHLLVENKNGNVTEAEVKTLINKQPKNKARLKEVVENALKHWLPSQEMFDRFVAKQKKSSQGNSCVGSDQQKSKDDQDQSENPNDFRDPSVEQKERLLATDEDIADDEDKEIAKEEAVATSQDPPSVQCLRNLICLDEKEVKPFRDLLDDSKVWELDDNRRVQLVYVLQSKFFSNASSEFLEVSGAYMKLHHQLKELRNQWDIEVMKKCHVIGMTVTGATMRANLLADIKPSVMIVEEAAEILEGQLVAVIPPSVQHLIMIGDHKQLKPVVHFHRLKKHHHLDLSMFERLVNCKIPFKQLGYQCRMRDEFVDLLRELKIYSELKTNHELVKDNHSPACVESSMYFWTHTNWEGESKASHSKRNSREAEVITEVAITFCREGRVPPSKITVLCSYRGQVQEIRNHFRSSKVVALEAITVTTIDSFQGQENDIILISLVRSNKEGKIGYLSSMNRLCVAISRARCGLYLFGNNAQLAKASSKGWRVVSNSMRSKGCLGYRFPFRSSAESFFQKSQRHAESPSVSESPINVTYIDITTKQANVNIGGDNSVNTINANSGDTPLDATSPPRSGIHLLSPKSGKMPVQDPKSPLPRHPEPTSLAFETGTPRLATQDARSPSQETPGKKKSLDTGEVESSKERPVQESLNPKDSMHETPQTEIPSPQQLASEEDSKAMPVQETEEAKSRKSDLEDQPRDVLQEGELQEDKAVEERGDLSNKVSTDKHEGDSSGEQPFQVQDFEEFDKEKPLQETEGPGKTAGDLPEGKPLQETFSSKVEDESSNEEALSTQETMSAGKGPFEEIGVDKDKALQETQGVSKMQGDDGDNTKEIQEGEGVLQVEDTEVKPYKQETGSSEVETGTSIIEEVVPTQETMAAGKGPFEETGVDKDKAMHETQAPSKAQGAEGNMTKEIQEGEGVLQEDSEVKPPKQETGSSEIETGTSIIEEVVPTQETMSAGKGPFEETGVDKDKALQETQAPSKAQGAEGDTTNEIQEGEDALQVEDSEVKPSKQETGSSEVETGTSIKEEVVPTQETMATGKGPSEETGVDKDKALQETQTPNKAQGAEGDTTNEIQEGEDALQVEDSEVKPSKQETGSSEVETGTSIKEEVVPTQETMAAGKGPFEETGLEVGIKGHPTDEQG